MLAYFKCLFAKTYLEQFGSFYTNCEFQYKISTNSVRLIFCLVLILYKKTLVLSDFCLQIVFRIFICVLCRNYKKKFDNSTLTKVIYSEWNV